MKKTLTILTFLAFVISIANAQVKFKINYDQAQERYTIALVPEVDYASPQNITGGGQVTIKVPTGAFQPIDLISYQPGMVWESNAISESPIEAPEFDYYSFGVVAAGLVKPDYRAGEEMPLFSFKNQQGCVGVICLMDNENDPFLAPNSKHANVGNQLTILGAGNGAYSGNVADGRIDCSVAINSGNNHSGNLTPEDFIIYPNPAVSKIKVEFDWANDDEEIDIEVYNIRGKLVSRKRQLLNKGFNRLKLDITDLPLGTYFLEVKGVRTKEFIKIGA